MNISWAGASVNCIGLSPLGQPRICYSEDTEYKTQVTLLLQREDDIGYSVVPMRVLQEFANTRSPEQIGFIKALFGRRQSYRIPLLDMLDGLDEHI